MYYASSVCAISLQQVLQPGKCASSSLTYRMSEPQLRKIVGFHQDEHADWVAELLCGHTQHVRHNPPWSLRPWVINVVGRNEHLGMLLPCRKCQQET